MEMEGRVDCGPKLCLRGLDSHNRLRGNSPEFRPYKYSEKHAPQIDQLRMAETEQQALA